MSIGSFAIPVPVLVFFLSLFAVWLVSAWVEKRAPGIQRDVTLIVIAGVIAARMGFVLRYLAAFRASPWAAFDIRDLGFEPLAGVIVGVPRCSTTPTVRG